MKREIVVGLVGQPNVGKSTLFNVLTKGNAIVTNWPGTTVERSEGILKHRGVVIRLVDLPGIYGLTYLTPEERISRKFITEERPDLLVVLVDSTILERTLYLVVDILEFTGRVVVGVTKVDEVHSRGIHINYELLAKRLNVPVIPLSAIKESGLDALLDAIVENAGVDRPTLIIDYGELEPYIRSIEEIVAQSPELSNRYPPRWLAVKYLEGDIDVEALIEKLSPSKSREIEGIREEARKRLGRDLAAFISTKRLQFINGYIVKGAVVIAPIKRRREPHLYKLLYSSRLAPLVSIGILFIVFLAVFLINTGFPLTLILDHMGYSELAELIEEYTLASLIERGFESLATYLESWLGESIVTSFVVEGVLGGVAAVVVFIPLITVVMMALGVLEDSGLLPRLAIGVHYVLRKFGLSGHALLPLSISMGCNVPGVMTTRSVLSFIERLKLALLAPFIPCQARLVVLLALASAIGGFAGLVLIPLSYLTSFLVVILLSLALDLILRRGEEVEIELLLELPPIHRPYFKVVWWFTWRNLKHFLFKAGTIIFAVSIVTWLLSNLSPNWSFVSEPSESVLASFSRALAPLLIPLGVRGENSWIAAYALIIGFLAKELIISAFMIASGSTSLNEALTVIGASKPSIVALALFITLYVPCLATVATIYNETKSLKYTLTSIALMLLVAYALGALTYTLATIVFT